MSVTLYQGDCLHELGRVADSSVNLILGDLPYGTTACAWDSIIPLEPLWAHFRRILAPRGAVVLTAAQPFTTTLISSNRAWFRYTWVWDKVNLFTNHVNAHKMPMRQHEDVIVFYPAQPTYNRQMREGKPYTGRGTGTIEIYGLARRKAGNTSGEACPATILRIPARSGNEMGKHPTQKPLALMEYLIKTYSNPGDVVCDPTMGSGTTGEAAVTLDRAFIGCELDPGYFATAQARIVAAQARARQLPLDAAS